MPDLRDEASSFADEPILLLLLLPSQPYCKDRLCDPSIWEGITMVAELRPAEGYCTR